MLPSDGAGAVTCLVMTTAGLLSAYGGFPVRSWNAVHAKAY